MKMDKVLIEATVGMGMVGALNRSVVEEEELEMIQCKDKYVFLNPRDNNNTPSGFQTAWKRAA